MTCDCGRPAQYHPLIALRMVHLCAECYAVEFPERAATFELARHDPNADEFQEPGGLR
jgi:hypothetical protein